MNQPSPLTVALVGRPNAGKTSLMMHLTQAPQRPVNFPGTSVERSECEVLRGGKACRVVDLPGFASLQPQSRDEAVSVAYLRGEDGGPPTVLCAAIDACKLPVELRLLQQLRTLSLPLVVALCKADIARSEGMPVDAGQLERALGLPVVVVDGLRGHGIEALWAALDAAAGRAPVVVPAPLAGPIEPPWPESTGSTWSDRIDAWLLHPWLGPVSLLLLLLVLFQGVFAAAEPLVGLLEDGQGLLSAQVSRALPEGLLQSFLVDGVINGLGSVFVFVPQIALLIAFVTLLEGSGYMARAVFLLDRLLRRFGLSGRSFVPLCSSFACAIPGILATRILSDERDRLATILVAPLMSCSARLPVYVVLLAAFFEPWAAGLLLFGLYLLGPVVAAGVAVVLRRTALAGGGTPLVLELPRYQRPSLKVVFLQARSAVRQFLLAAGSVIFVATVVVWALSVFPRDLEMERDYEARIAATALDPQAEAEPSRLRAELRARQLEASWLADLGKAIQPVFAPAGFDWRHTVAALSAFPARELALPTLAVLHNLGEVEASADEPDPGLTAALRHAIDAQGRPTMNGLVALAMMAFFALCSQCASTLAAIRRETHSWRWPLFTFAYMTALAWAAAVLIYQAGSLLGYGLPGH